MVNCAFRYQRISEKNPATGVRCYNLPGDKKWLKSAQAEQKGPG